MQTGRSGSIRQHRPRNAVAEPFTALLCLILMGFTAIPAAAATEQSHYYAHDAVHDSYGVIAPWYQGQNGLIDFRVRVAAEFLKRYPWVDVPQSVMAGPHYVFNARVDLDDAGNIAVLGATDGMNGNLGQRFKYLSESWPRYYRYTGDPTGIGHLKIAADFLLEHYQTSADHPWPRFPISVPLTGKPYGPARPGGYIQLDLSAGIGRGMLTVYQLTGDRRYLDAARHWGDVLAEKCNRTPGARPWNRYANPEQVPWCKAASGNIQTGGVCNILLFLEELVRLGYTGPTGAILEAREAGRTYLRDTLLPRWFAWDTWGRHYWDWEHPVQGIVPTDWASSYLMDHPDLFPNWTSDVRNILTMFIHHACVSPNSNGDAYSGAWAYPESCSCCGRSLDICPVFLSRYMARYGAMADNAWAREVARREIILGLYHFHSSGKVEDNIDGGQITAREWSELIGMGPILCGLEVLEWLPELAPARENHILRTSGLVRSVVYGDGRVEYVTFDAPAGGQDLLRLAFTPQSVAADGKALAQLRDLNGNGYRIERLPCGDCLVTIRHDGAAKVAVTGEDPQQVVDDGTMEYTGDWQGISDPADFHGGAHVADAKGATATVRFQGNQVRLTGRVAPEGGRADVLLDGALQPVPIDCWSPLADCATTDSPASANAGGTPAPQGAGRHQQVLYYRNGLAGGLHELKIVVRGEKNPCATGTKVWIDAVQWSDQAAKHTFGSGGGSTHAQRMIFGYTSRNPYVDSAGNAWLPATEVVIRTGHHTDPVSSTWWTEPVSQPILGARDAEPYRYGIHAPEFWTNVTVGPGTYRVRLLWAERRALADPKRQPMTVRVNGRVLAQNFDVAAAAGGLCRAAQLILDGVQPKHGTIEVRLTGTNGGEAALQALEITPSDGTTRNPHPENP